MLDLARIFGHRWFAKGAVAVGLLLTLPALGMGFTADDFFFLNRLEVGPPPTFQLYEFTRGEPGQIEKLIDTRWIAFPWWMDPEFKVRFMRPLSSGLFALDHALFGRAAAAYHAHGLVWFGLLLTAVGMLLRRACSAPTWQIALGLYAVCSSHAEVASWISGRHMLVGSVPALFGLLALIDRRERAFRWGLPLGLLGMVVGLAGSEAALPVVLFWLAYELWGAPGSTAWTERARRAALPLLLLGLYTALYKALGYGVAHSAMYVDPVSSPVRFLAQLPKRLALLLGEMFVTFPSSLGLTVMPKLGVTLGVLSTLAVGLVLRARWGLLAPEDRRALGWLGGGCALSLAATAGALLGPRMVLVPGIAGFVAIACVLRHCFQGRAARLVAVPLLVIHAALAPVLLVANAFLLADMGKASWRIDASLDPVLREHRSRAGKPPRVFVLSSSDPFAAFYAAAVRAVREPGTSAQWTILSMARATHRVERTAHNRITLRPDTGLLLTSFEGLFRDDQRPFLRGDRVLVSGGTVEVLTVTDGRPTSVSLVLDVGSFDDPDVVLVTWQNEKLTPVSLGVGQELEVAWSPGPSGLL